MTAFERIVVLTGAGISAESGLGTFRDTGGIWTKFRIEDYATPEAFARDPHRVLDFYSMRRSNLAASSFNAAHAALAEAEAALGSRLYLVTQNVDDLHEQAGSRQVVHMHGRLGEDLCQRCGHVSTNCETISAEAVCGACGTRGSVRPNVVWFGEMPHHMDEIYDRLTGCDLFVSIGTSGTVYPAAGFVMEAARAGAHTVELNLEPSDGHSLFAEKIYGPATEVVPRYFAALTG